MAIRYFKSGGTAWNTSTSWATSIGGTDNAPAVPSVLDDVYFDASSAASCPITTTAALCKTLTCTGYTGTITTATSLITLTVSGNVVLGVGHTISGSGALIINVAASLTSAANPNINCPVTFSTAATFTLVDDWTFNGLFTTSPAGGTCTINGSNIFCKAGMSINSAGSSASLTTGTTNIFITGTGSISTSANSTGGISNNFTINAPGSTITLAQANFFYRTNTFKYIAGTFSGTWNVNITSSACTLDMTNGGSHTLVTPFSLIMQVASTITLASDWYLSGINVGFATTINGSNMYTTGTFTCTVALQGTAVIRFKSTGSGQAVSSTAYVSNDIGFEAGANTITIGNFFYTANSGGSTITYTSGAVNHTGLLTIQGANTTTLNTSGMSWNNITLTATSFTLSLSSLLTAAGTLTFGTGNYTFAGASGFTVGTMTYIVTPAGGANTGIVLAPTKTYTVTTSINLYPLVMATLLGIKTSTPGSQAVLNFTGVPQTIGNVQVTDINSSAGSTLWVWKPGTLSNTSNWKTMPAFVTVVSS